MSKKEAPSADNNTENETEDILPEVQQELSKVATNPKRNITILIVICTIIGYLIFTFFFDDKNPAKENKVLAPANAIKPIQTSVTEVPAIPQLPEPPKLVEPEVTSASTPLDLPSPIKSMDLPSLPVALPTDQNVAQNPTPNNAENILPIKSTDEEEIRRKEAKRKSKIILLNDGSKTKTPEQVEQEQDFTQRGDLAMVLGRGKVIDAVLESSINTDLVGEIRALVSRDVYSENGKIVLIPKGSRIFGTFSSDNSSMTYGRILVNWNRIDLSSGYTINIQSPTVDNLGKPGLQGRVDNKYTERMSNILLASAFNIAFANVLDKIVAPPLSNQASVANAAAASQLNDIALAIYNGNQSTALKIQLICSNVQAAIPDKTSTAYTSFVSSCFSLKTNPSSASDAQNLTSLMSSVNSAASAILTNNSALTTTTKAQDASKQAFEDVTQTIKDITQQQQLKPNITIAQGTPFKIYVNKDYKFPKAAIKSKVIR